MLKQIKEVTFEDRPVPELRDAHDVIVHVAQTGICGSDVHYWQRGRIGPYIVQSPMVLGMFPPRDYLRTALILQDMSHPVSFIKLVALLPILPLETKLLLNLECHVVGASIAGKALTSIVEV